MIIPRISKVNVSRSLTFRLLLILSLILLPLGAIAVYQTWSLQKSIESRASNEVLSRTIRSMAREGIVLERAKGAVEALSRITPELRTADTCLRDFFQDFLDRGEHYTFVGRLETSLSVDCSSSETVVDVSGNENLLAGVRLQEPFSYATSFGRVSQRPVLVFVHPVFDDTDAIDHYAMLSVATDSAVPTRDSPGLDDSVGLFVFARDGRVISADADTQITDDELPSSRNLARLAGPEPRVFTETSNHGEDRVYAMVPLHDGLAYALAAFPVSVLSAGGVTTGIPTWFLPLLMWLATLVVVYIAISRLVVTPVRHLARRMRRFAKNRAMPSPLPMGDIPKELVDMNKTFEGMANAILRDEAELEDALREKSILVREIHHRVKNNLQLIASIMNMQIRKSRASETSDVVRRLQERVLGLATVHRQMYESSSLTDVEIGPLLQEILRQILRRDGDGAPRITTDIADTELIPDQAVPLSLLAAEASMNAIRYVGRDEGGEGWIDVRFGVDDDMTCHLIVANSITRDDMELAEIKDGSSGLGTQLIQAFAAQLGGEVSVDESDEAYRISVSFSPTKDRGSDAAAEVIHRMRGNAA